MTLTDQKLQHAALQNAVNPDHYLGKYFMIPSLRMERARLQQEYRAMITSKRPLTYNLSSHSTVGIGDPICTLTKMKPINW